MILKILDSPPHPPTPWRSISGHPLQRPADAASGLSPEEAHKAAGGEIADEEGARVAGGGGEGFGGLVAAAHGALHGGGPAAARPVAGEEDARPLGLRLGAVAVGARKR
jgi:hypothetical protein